MKEMRFLPAAVFLLCLALPGGVRGEEARRVKGLIYSLDGSRLLYRWEMLIVPPGQTPWQTWYYDPAGRLAASDRLTWKNGRLVGYDYQRENIGEEARVWIQGGKVHYYLRRDGVESRREEEAPLLYAAGASPIRLIQEHWEELAAGKELLIRYGVLDLTRSFEFVLARADRQALDPAGSVTIAMYPSSMFLRFFVDPVYICFQEDGSFLSLSGRLLPVDLADVNIRPTNGRMVLAPGEPGSTP